jgi:hypothetical protein
MAESKVMFCSKAALCRLLMPPKSKDRGFVDGDTDDKFNDERLDFPELGEASSSSESVGIDGESKGIRDCIWLIEALSVGQVIVLGAAGDEGVAGVFGVGSSSALFDCRLTEPFFIFEVRFVPASVLLFGEFTSGPPGLAEEEAEGEAGTGFSGSNAFLLTNIPFMGPQVKYCLPWTDPLFLPLSSSSSTPNHSP